MNKFCLLLCLPALLTSCGSTNSAFVIESPQTINSLSFIDEIVIPNTMTFEDTKIGGLSSIDYVNGTWFAICDDRVIPRFYKLDLQFSEQGIKAVKFTDVIFLKNSQNTAFAKGAADPESLRITNDGAVIWTSEGNILKRINPFIRIATRSGNYLTDIELPKRYTVEQEGIKGPRNNGVFEAVSRDYNSNNFWTITELPLEEDGDVPTALEANAPVRIAHIDASSKSFGKEFAYPLDKVARQGTVEINGVTEIISYDKDSFLVLERSYARGYKDGGNNVKIYKVFTDQATDISTMESLMDSKYVPVKKELLLNLESIRTKLTNGMVDNLEGMTFGPNFSNGNRSLILVSDNNFNTNQISQIILLEVH